MFWIKRPAQAGETYKASNQIDSLIRHLERLIIEKICEFRVSLYSVGIINIVKKMDAIFTEFR